MELLKADLEVLMAPAEFDALGQRDLRETVCVVFDVLRATSSMITALANGANSIIPVAEIPEALALRLSNPNLVLAGERDGVKITAERTGSIGFDHGNSPREFLGGAVLGRDLCMSTTNGTRALRACSGAKAVLAASFLNLTATAEYILRADAAQVLLVCGGTFEQAAYEDVLGAGALADKLWSSFQHRTIADSALVARTLYLMEAPTLERAFGKARNGQRLLARPDLAPDVQFCAQKDRFNLVAIMAQDGRIRRSA